MYRLASIAVLMFACTGNGSERPREIQQCDSQPQPGATCSEGGKRCWSTSDGFQCSENRAQAICECNSSGVWVCAPSDPGRGDPVCLANDDCYTEGFAICDGGSPPDRHCVCDSSGAVWSCASICDGCPSTPPSEGAACGPIPEGHCSYGGLSGPSACCTCVGGAFNCTTGC